MRKYDDDLVSATSAESLTYDLTGLADPVGDLLAAPVDRMYFDGETVREYVIAPADDPQQRLARVIPAAHWDDLRHLPVSHLPEPASALYNVWEVQRAAGKPLYLGSRFLGITYRTGAETAVLTNSLPLACFDLSSLISLIFGPPAPLPACPTTTPISGAGVAWSAYFTTRAAAVTAARGLVPGRAAVDAGLELNGFTCPNPACPNKTLGAVFPALTSVDSYLSVTGSLLYLEWRYIARADYTWASSITCT